MGSKNKIKNLKYADLSNAGDQQLKLISSFLLKIHKPLKVNELHFLGEFMISYLNNKIVLDYAFWQRPLELCELNDEEIENAVINIRNKLVDNT